MCDKKACYYSKDQISKLPDEILVGILSLMTLSEAAVTSVLSRRWKCLWASRYRLDFDGAKAVEKTEGEPDELLQEERLKFRRWVRNAIKLHNGHSLEEFRVNFDLDNDSDHDIDLWLTFALSKSVQRLELDLGRHPMRRRRFEVHKEYCSFPASLCLQPCTFAGFKSLKSLSLKRIKITWEVLESVLLNSPFLESLVLSNLLSLDSFKVVGPSLMLKYLDITHCEDLGRTKICDADVVSLRFDGTLEDLFLRNVPHLVELCIAASSWDSINDHFNHRFPWALSQLEHLSLAFKGYQDYDNLHLIGEFTRLKKLGLFLLANEVESLLVYTCLIKAAPKLQKLVVQVRSHLSLFEPKEVRPVERWHHQQLKVVEFGGYFGRTNEDELILYLIENAVGLETIRIDPIPHWYEHGNEKSPDQRNYARDCAKQRFKGRVPSHINLVIL